MARIVAGVCVVVLTLGQGWATARVQANRENRETVGNFMALLFIAVLWWLGKGAASTSREYDK